MKKSVGGKPPAAPVLPAEEDSKEYAINACHYSKVQEAMAIIENTPGMEGIRTLGALPLEEGASLAPLDEAIMKAKLENNEIYMCGAPLWITNPFRDASPGVPIDTKQVQTYMEHNFLDVDNIKLPHVQFRRVVLLGSRWSLRPGAHRSCWRRRW